MEKLNKSKPYGSVYGDPNVAYEQDGKRFRPDGTLYIPPDGLTPEKPEDLPKKTLTLRNDKLREAWNKRLNN